MKARIIVLALSLAVLAPSAASAGTLTTFTMTSQHVPGDIGVSVLLPDGYDAARAYPVLYLLHGYGETHAHWAAPSRGDAARLAAGFEGIIVMPDQAGGFSVDHHNGGRFGPPGWTRFFSGELIPEVERRFSIREGRRWHAIAGASMGGYGAVLIAAQRPDYFGSVASFSGLLSVQRPEVALAITALGTDYEQMLGPREGPYAEGHNPVRIAGNLASTRVLTLVGDGRASGSSVEVGADYPLDRAFLLALGAPVEAAVRIYNDEFAAAAREAGVPLQYRVRDGIHDWPDMRRGLPAAIAWNPFASVPEVPDDWSYRTSRPEGRAWQFLYRLAAPPAEVVRLRYRDGFLSGEGAGEITITGPGCSFTATLPFSRACPAQPPPGLSGPSAADPPRPRSRAGCRDRPARSAPGTCGPTKARSPKRCPGARTRGCRSRGSDARRRRASRAAAPRACRRSRGTRRGRRPAA